MKNTVSFRCLAYQESKTFTGVCLDLDIVEEGHTSLQEAVLSLNDAISSHLSALKKLGWPRELMNRPAPDIYWNRLESFLKAKSPQTVTHSPIQAYNYAEVQTT